MGQTDPEVKAELLLQSDSKKHDQAALAVIHAIPS